MDSLEKDIENRFFEIITKQKENPSSNAYKIYQKLVYYRFEEIIHNTFPEFIKYISLDELETTIFEFMKEPPTTPYVWQIANDYRKFVEKENYFKNREYLNELLFFDWIEVELTMYEYKNITNSSLFSWKNKYKLSKSARLKECFFDIIKKEYKNKRNNFLIIYFDFYSKEVYFREINQFLYVLLQRLNTKNTIEEVLKELCIENEINLKEAKKILEEPLIELFKNKVFYF